ncbi:MULTISPECIES: phage holin family protein [unclassified Janthinobacterium]|uniref:phage holin family protein n=1 Tax=unclassified Janthinobacterium TaxID=2610881 RepID=UPI0016118FE2|nr:MULTISPECIES: phage holin family protein [unclassified Janthinobacterium]MBB5369246.1 putative membrane protein YqjE [Janthinobacterium sp. K2C7]MBB5381217.1 putative membrane protein YqjE [Janthinobacterium sp. K2Li3]MBB5387629.1 putative membrane protein YqjE [Janthinobacterium sp. K2E3]
MDKSASSHQGAGLIASFAGLARNAVGLMLSRLELATIELSEVRNHVLQLIVIFALATVAGLFAIAYGSVLIVFLAWDSLGWKILLIMTAVFVLLAIGLVIYARAMLSQGKLSMPATMAELKADRDMLM